MATFILFIERSELERLTVTSVASGGADMSILILVASVIGVAGCIDAIFMQNYGTLADFFAWAFLIVLCAKIVSTLVLLIDTAIRGDSEKSTDRAYDRVEPGETEQLKSGEIVDTAWSKLTNERTAHYHDPH